MKRKILIALLFSTLFVNTVYGNTIPINSLKTNYDGNKVRTVAEKQVKGEYLALGILELSNRGEGQVGIYIQTLAHEYVDKIRMRVYLDMYDEKGNQWNTVDYFDFTYLSENYDGKLADPFENFIVQGEGDRYYRLRGLHMVWKDGVTESFNTETDPLLITKDPR